MTSTTGFPSVSMLVLTYQQHDLLDQAVANAFAQDCGPIEIVLSDDGSMDGSYERLQALAASYQGPHCVVVRPRTPNLGIAEHYNELLKFARGELLVTAAGDDVSTPDRVQRLVEAWDADGRRADLIASHLIDMDISGGLHDLIRVDDLAQWHGIDDWMRSRPYIVGAGHAFTRRMYERFGPMLPTVAYEDQIMVFRAMAMGGAITVDAPLVHYRRGGAFGQPEDHQCRAEGSVDRAPTRPLVGRIEPANHRREFHRLRRAHACSTGRILAARPLLARAPNSPHVERMLARYARGFPAVTGLAPAQATGHRVSRCSAPGQTRTSGLPPQILAEPARRHSHCHQAATPEHLEPIRT